MSDAVLAAIARLVGPEVAVAVEPVDSDTGLIGEEIAAIEKAIPKRRAEFAAGRRAARRALSTFGLASAIPAGADRAPLWPQGYAGAITHDNGLAAAIVARADVFAGLGVDLAEATPFPENLRTKVLITKDERALNGMDARAVFSAKEALYKALSPQVQTFFGFEAATITPDFANNTFTAVLQTPLGRFHNGTTFQGGLEIVEDRLIATLTHRG